MTDSKLEGAPSWTWKALIAIALGIMTLLRLCAGNATRPGANGTPALPIGPPAPQTTASVASGIGLYDSHHSSKARLEGIAYSYTKKIWASYDSLFGSRYPSVRGLGFFTGLGWGVSMTWDGTHSISSHQIILAIQNLRLPHTEFSGIKVIGGDLPHWNDFGVGYYVELKNAIFDDYAIAKTLLIYKTFRGDTPPSEIQKEFNIRTVEATDLCPNVVAGEWHGIYMGENQEGEFVMRIAQLGNTITGTAIDFQSKGRLRSQLEGWIVDGRLTLIKHYGDDPIGLSYISSNITSASELSGIWSASPFVQGEWKASFKGMFKGSIDDLPTSMPK